MKLNRALTLAATAVLAVTMAACSGDQPAKQADRPHPAPSVTAPDGAAGDETPFGEEAPDDTRGMVNRTGTWAEYDETTIPFTGWDDGQVDVYAAADAALDFLYLAAQHETAFHTHTLDDLALMARDNDPAASELEAAWYFHETMGEAAERGGLPLHHISPLSLVSNSTLDVYESAKGFTANGHDLRISEVAGHVHTDTSLYEGVYTDELLVGPIVGVDIHLTGTIRGTDAEGTPTSIDAPFSTFTVITTRDEDGTWKLLAADAWASEDFVGDGTADEKDT